MSGPHAEEGWQNSPVIPEYDVEPFDRADEAPEGAEHDCTGEAGDG